MRIYVTHKIPDFVLTEAKKHAHTPYQRALLDGTKKWEAFSVGRGRAAARDRRQFRERIRPLGLLVIRVGADLRLVYHVPAPEGVDLAERLAAVGQPDASVTYVLVSESRLEAYREGGIYRSPTELDVDYAELETRTAASLTTPKP